jgi:hypothetical protein
MDYGLAKQLKDAEFPQKEGCDFNTPPRHDRPCCTAPTLEELIEACAPSEKWMVIMTVTDKGSIAAKMGQTGEASTLTEAVAHLWLALHANGDASD